MPFHLSPPYLLPIILLLCSNLFMTVAWYGHLRFKEVPLAGVILASWASPLSNIARRPGEPFRQCGLFAAQLKTMQEVITLWCLRILAGLLKEPIGWNHLVGFALISAGAFFHFSEMVSAPADKEDAGIMANHRLEAGPETVHWGFFDAELKPLLTVNSGDTVTISTVSGMANQMPAARSRCRPRSRDHKSVQQKLPGHMCTGPVAVKGAKAGQALEVRIKDIELHYDWATT